MKRTTILSVLAALLVGTPTYTSAEFVPQSVQVNGDTGNVSNQWVPDLAVTKDGTIYVVWSDENTQTGVCDIKLSRSVDGGKTFSASTRINDDTGAPYNAYMPEITVDGTGTIYVVWFDYRNFADLNYIDVYLDKSIDGGSTWGTDILVSTSTNGAYPWQFDPSIAVDDGSGRVYVSFTDYSSWTSTIPDMGDVRVAVSSDRGTTFQSAVTVNDDVTLEQQSWSHIAVSPVTGDVYVVFQDRRSGTDWDIYSAKSTNGGQYFSNNVRVNDASERDQHEPDVSVGENGVVS